MFRPAVRLGTALASSALLLGALLTGTAVTTPSADPGPAAGPVVTSASLVGVTTPRTPAGLPAAIESLAGYDEQVSCDPHIRPGTRKLARLLAATYSSARSWSSTYACGTDGGRSEHYDGRAIDWMVDIHNAKQVRAARATLSWLLRTDRAGNRYAMARRLGVMYVIYDNRMWGGWSGRWEDYNGCAKRRSHADDNSCHRTHMHISLSWNGAMGRTTFWTKRVSRTDYGPCRLAGLSWAPRYRHANLVGCPQVPAATAPRGATATKKALVAWSGMSLGRGAKGSGVSAVQRALHVSSTGTYATSTVTAVRRFQSRHHLPVTGSMSGATWLALLRAVR